MPYGRSTRYAEHVRSGIKVVMPAGTPSILQQFFRTSADGKPGHLGLDVTRPVGQPVLAAAAGRVVSSNYEPFYGHRISILHGADAEGVPLRTVYVHLSKRQVAVGDRVARGQQIGRLGHSGLLSTLPHLHFELHRMAPDRDTPINPHLGWMDGVGRVTCFEPDRQYPEAPVRMTYPVICAARDM